MRTILLTALTLCATTTMVLAEPLKLTDRQMDKVTAAGPPSIHVAPTLAFNVAILTPVSVANGQALGLAIGVGGPRIQADISRPLSGYQWR